MRLLILLILLPFITQGQIVRTHPYYKPMVVTACSDADAQKFIDSAGIADQTQKDAICTLVRELKDSSLWTSMSAIYPFVGGTASSQKWNLKTPGTYNLGFNGGWTHTSNGAKANGTTGYATTGIAYSTFSNDIATSFYLGDTTSGGFGAFAQYETNHKSYYCGGGVNSFSLVAYSFSDSYTYSFTGTALGYYMGVVSATGAGGKKGYKNGVEIASGTVSGSSPSVNIEIARNPYAGGIEYKGDQYRLITIGTALNATDARALNTIVEKFNDALGRGVQ